MTAKQLHIFMDWSQINIFWVNFAYRHLAVIHRCTPELAVLWENPRFWGHFAFEKSKESKHWIENCKGFLRKASIFVIYSCGYRTDGVLNWSDVRWYHLTDSVQKQSRALWKRAGKRAWRRAFCHPLKALWKRWAGRLIRPWPRWKSRRLNDKSTETF